VPVKVSPTLFVFVQTREFDVMLSEVPLGSVPTAPPAPVLPVVTLLPLLVVVGVVLVFVVLVVVVERVPLLVVEVRGAVVPLDVPARVVLVPVGTSFSCGCAALSRFASARSRLSDVSTASVSRLLSFVEQATAANARPSTGMNERIYFVVIVMFLGKRGCGNSTPTAALQSWVRPLCKRKPCAMDESS
jgi:hypothetical protein